MVQVQLGWTSPSAKLGLTVLKAIEFPLAKLELLVGHGDRMKSERKLGQQYRDWKHCRSSSNDQALLRTSCVTLNKLFNLSEQTFKIEMIISTLGGGIIFKMKWDNVGEAFSRMRV